MCVYMQPSTFTAGLYLVHRAAVNDHGRLQLLVYTSWISLAAKAIQHVWAQVEIEGSVLKRSSYHSRKR